MAVIRPCLRLSVNGFFPSSSANRLLVHIEGRKMFVRYFPVAMVLDEHKRSLIEFLMGGAGSLETGVQMEGCYCHIAKHVNLQVVGAQLQFTDGLQTIVLPLATGGRVLPPRRSGREPREVWTIEMVTVQSSQVFLLSGIKDFAKPARNPHLLVCEVRCSTRRPLGQATCPSKGSQQNVPDEQEQTFSASLHKHDGFPFVISAEITLPKILKFTAAGR